MFINTLLIVVKNWKQLNVYKKENEYYCGISLQPNTVQKFKKKI